MTIPIEPLINRLELLQSIAVPWSTIRTVMQEMGQEPFYRPEVREIQNYLETHVVEPSPQVKNLIRCRLRLILYHYIRVRYPYYSIPEHLDFKSVPKQDLGHSVLESHPVVG
jgi:hypothetical protein